MRENCHWVAAYTGAGLGRTWRAPRSAGKLRYMTRIMWRRLRRPPAILLLSLIGLLAGGCSPASELDEDSDWALYGNGYNNQRYSSLARINRDNVGSLELAWRYHTGIKAAFETNPLVKDGVMYITTPYNNVVALDAASGREIWRYEHQLRDYQYCCGPANRGAALAGGKVIMGTIDARLIALDQKTGEVVWDVRVTDPQAGTAEELAAVIDATELKGAKKVGYSGYTVNMAPQVFDGLVYVGISGAGYGLHLEQNKHGEEVLTVAGISGGGHGLRGFIVAYDVDTGEEVWRWYTVPKTGWEGEFVSETAYGVDLKRNIEREQKAFDKYSETWRFGGGSIMTTPAIDPELGLLFLGTGNPSPQFDGTTRPGDNLHTASLIALDAHTGELVWAYQQVPHDRWGYGTISPPVLLQVEHGGETIPAIAQAGKVGWLFVHDRRTGELLHRSEPLSPQENLFAPPTADGARVVPGAFGAVSWTPTAFNPDYHTMYIPTIYAAGIIYERKVDDPTGPVRSYTFFQEADEPDWGYLTAIDMHTGRIRWREKMSDPMVGGALTTAGGLVFVGEGNGYFDAFDAETGERLWRFTAAAGVNAPPITYAADGRQFIAVAAGGNHIFGYETGDEILVFALPK